MSKFVQPSWFVEVFGKATSADTLVRCKNGEVLFRVYTGQGRTFQDRLDVANLAGAAPDLLACCEAFISWFDQDTPHEQKPPFAGDMLNVARAAVAKAKGAK